MTNSIFQQMTNQASNSFPNQLLNMLKMTNPNAYNELNGILNGGDINKAISKYASQMNPQQLGQLKGMARQFGISEQQLSQFIK